MREENEEGSERGGGGVREEEEGSERGEGGGE